MVVCDGLILCFLLPAHVALRCRSDGRKCQSRLQAETPRLQTRHLSIRFNVAFDIAHTEAGRRQLIHITLTSTPLAFHLLHDKATGHPLQTAESPYAYLTRQ